MSDGALRAGWCDTVPYREAVALLDELRSVLQAQVDDGRTPSSVVFALSHPSTITLGRRARPEHVLLPQDELAIRRVDVVETDRGGEATWHGPGQLVVYPVVHLPTRRVRVDAFVAHLAGAACDVLDALEIPARFDRERPGVWVGNAKIGSVGLRVSRGVTTHGLALNVSCALEPFRWIVPCGLPDGAITSVAEQLREGATAPRIDELARQLVDALARRLDVPSRWLGEVTMSDLALKPAAKE